MTQTRPTPRQRPPDAVYKVLNPTFKAILRSPLHRLLSQRLLVLTFTGRTSGRRYSIPVGYTQVDNTLLIATQSRWWKNLRDNARVQVRLRGHTRTGTTEAITDEQGLWESFSVMLPGSPQLGEIIGIRLAADGRPDRADVADAHARGYVVIRVRLD